MAASSRSWSWRRLMRAATPRRRRRSKADEAAEAGRAPVVPVDRSLVGGAYQPAQRHLHAGPGGLAGLMDKLQRRPQGSGLGIEVHDQVTAHAMDVGEQAAGTRQGGVVPVLDLSPGAVVAEQASPSRVGARSPGSRPPSRAAQHLLAQQCAEGLSSGRRQRPGQHAVAEIGVLEQVRWGSGRWLSLRRARSTSPSRTRE